MNIGVAILAALPNIGENRSDVTLGTADRPMHAEQRVTGLIVVEFRYRSNGLPRVGGMTVLTRNVEIAVRAMSDGRGLCRCAAG